MSQLEWKGTVYFIRDAKQEDISKVTLVYRFSLAPAGNKHITLQRGLCSAEVLFFADLRKSLLSTRPRVNKQKSFLFLFRLIQYGKLVGNEIAGKQ